MLDTGLNPLIIREELQHIRKRVVLLLATCLNPLIIREELQPKKGGYRVRHLGLNPLIIREELQPVP